MNQTVPVSKLSRSSIAGAAAIKMGMGELGHKIKRPFMSSKQQQEDKDNLEDKNAKLLFDTLTKLRGTALKVAQMLSMEVDILPKRYRKELEKSFHQVPPLNRVLVRKVLLQTFDQLPETLFKTFDDTAFAAASLGQVHNATLPDGTAVAVKIQYPGIHVAMDSDMNLMRKMALGMANKSVVLQSIDEIHARLMEEVDYKKEADNTRWFQEKLQLDGVSVPRVFDDWSGQHVLTTEFIDAKHLDDWLAENPSQEVRDQMAQRLYDLFIYSTFELQCLHADPNPGNYLFHADNTVSLIDFGCVKGLSTTFVNVLPKLMNAYNEDKPDEIFKAYGKLGMKYVNEGSELYEEILRPFGQWLARPFKEDSFDFGKHSDYTSSGKEAIQRLSRLAEIDNLADEFIFFDRTIYGLCKIFERMGATVKIRHHWQGS